MISNSPPVPPPFVVPNTLLVSNFYEGSSPTLRITALGNGPFHYQWYFNGPTPPIPGNDTNILFLPNLQPAQAGTYTVVVTGASS